MGANSHIAWTHSTLNWWIGCTKIALECQHCYAAALDEKRFSKTLEGTKAEPVSHWGKGAPRHLTNAARDGTLLKWNKRPWVCEGCGTFTSSAEEACAKTDQCVWKQRRRVFIGSLMDWADEEVSDESRDRLFDEAELATDLTLMFLTKRADNALRYLRTRYGPNCMTGKEFPKHFWIGYSYMHQDPRLAWLHEVKDMGATITFLSCEPMLARARLHMECQEIRRVFRHLGGRRGINWVIFGGESQESGGPAARPCSIENIRDGIAQCRAGGALPFVKQLGSFPTTDLTAVIPEADITDPSLDPADIAAWEFHRHNAKIHLKHPKGADPAEWPPDVQVQEIPNP